VGINAWSLHRNKEVYGEDAEEFRPERWQQKDNPERVKLMEQCFATFGFGSRTCIGKNMAYMEINKVFRFL
jgi:cytochrome P450